MITFLFFVGSELFKSFCDEGIQRAVFSASFGPLISNENHAKIYEKFFLRKRYSKTLTSMIYYD